jgi:nucleoid-associated protein YgaU
VGRETKFGLLVGVVFIVLFGVILSSRAGSPAGDHAVLPTGESKGHAEMARTMNRSVNPFMEETLSLDKSAPVVPGDRSTVVPVDRGAPPEEKVPAPEKLESDTLPVTKGGDRGTIAFSPARIDTPMEKEQPGVHTEGDGVIGKREPVVTPTATTATTTTAVAALKGPVHVVKPGETLISIANKYCNKDAEVSWRAILDANRKILKDEKHLAVGQKLVIPVAKRKELPAPAPAAAPADPATSAPADMPRKDAPRDVVAPDSMLATRTSAVRETPSRTSGALREVTPSELKRMLGTQGDLVESPASPIATYTVEAGDTFTKIAEKKYGDGKYGKLLYLKNQHLVPDEKRLKVGQKILLLDGLSPAAVAPPEAVVASARLVGPSI